MSTLERAIELLDRAEARHRATVLTDHLDEIEFLVDECNERTYKTDVASFRQAVQKAGEALVVLRNVLADELREAS